jgi:hypothetical protein
MEPNSFIPISLELSRSVVQFDLRLILAFLLVEPLSPFAV